MHLCVYLYLVGQSPATMESAGKICSFACLVRQISGGQGFAIALSLALVCVLFTGLMLTRGLKSTAGHTYYIEPF